MAKQLFANNIQMVITEFLSPSDTQITVASTLGIPSPSSGDYYLGTLIPVGGLGQLEIIKIVSIANNVLTVERGQEGTAAANYLFGSLCELRITAGTLDNLRDYNAPYPNATARPIDDKLQETYSVKDFGAVGDGVTDDTQAIQNAIAYLQTLETQSFPALYFPFGVFRITQPLQFSQRFLKVQGAGIGRAIGSTTNITGSTAILYDGADLDPETQGVLMFSDGPSANRGISVMDLSILCQHKANGIFSSGADMGEYDRVYIDKPLTGIVLHATCYSSMIQRVEVFDPRTGSFDLRNSDHSTVIIGCRQNNLYPNNVVTTETPAFGIRIGRDGNCSAVNVLGTSFDLYNVNTHLRMVSDCFGATIHGNYIECRGDGVTANAMVFEAGRGISISGNRITKSNNPTTTPIAYGIQFQAGVSGAAAKANYIAGFDNAAVRVANGASNVEVGPNNTGGGVDVVDQNTVRTTTLVSAEGVFARNTPTSGTYTPVGTAGTNVTGVTPAVCQYTRIGDVVTVSGQVNITTGATGDSTLSLSLPIASNFIAATQAAGVASDGLNQVGRVFGDTVNDVFTIRFQSTGALEHAWSFQVTYLVR